MTATKFIAVRENGSYYVAEIQASSGYFLGIVSEDCECQARAEAYAEEMNNSFQDEHALYLLSLGDAVTVRSSL
jgi:hypothetical protein